MNNWFTYCIVTGLIASPFIYLSCEKNEDRVKMFGVFIFINYAIGYYLVLVLLAIGSNILIIIFNILPKENFNENGYFADKAFYITHGLWYLFSLSIINKWCKKKDDNNIPNMKLS